MPSFRARFVSALTRSIPRCIASPGSSEAKYANEVERLSGRLRSDLDYVTIADIFEFGLHEYLETIQERLVELSDALYSTYCASEVEEVRA